MHLLTLNAAGKQLAPPRSLPKDRRRLSQVIGRHVDRTRPHMIAVQNARDPLQPLDEAWILRGKDKAGKIKPWPRRYLAQDDIVVVVYLPRGGGAGASGGSRSKSPLSIALSIAAVALVAFSGPIGGALAGVLGVTSAFGVSAVTAGVVLAGSALLGLASKSKANTAPTDETKVYGVSGGGNLPRPGDRIPKGYGRSWMKPDLSQPDFNQYDGDELILTKRHTLGLGAYRVYALRAGKQVIWREGPGFVPPFDDPRNKIEFLYGTPSTLAPSNVVAASGVGGELPRPQDVQKYSGPYLINQRGALVTRLQWDYQFPRGISRIDFLKQTTRANQPGEWGVQFEYAEINEAGDIIGPWMIGYSGNSGNEGPLFSTHPLRYTKFKDVPPGRYATRGINVAPDTSGNTTGTATENTAQWDAASGWVGDVAVRPGITEICARIYSTNATGAAAFGELEADASAIIPVWNGAAWVDQETSKAVWAYCDIMRNQFYGGALPDNQVDRALPLYYANTLDKFDTFDGVIRGPVSVYDAASTVLLPMRAEPVHLGRYWSLVRDDVKSVRKHNITRRQMLKGSTRITFDLDVTSGAAHVIGEYDRDGDYRNPGQTTSIFGEASLTPLRTRWAGVRTYEHAMHLTRWRAAIGAFRRQTIPFSVEMEGRIYKRGDAARVDPWFIEGRSTAGVLDYDSPSVFLDYMPEIQANDVALFRDRAGREWGPVKILRRGVDAELILDPGSIAEAERDTGTTLSSIMDNGRGDMTVVTIGQLKIISQSYLIQSVTMSGPRKAQVQAVADDPRVWEAIGGEIVEPPLGENGLASPESPRIVGLAANAVQMAAGLRCDYGITPGRGCVTFEIGISYDDGNRYDTRPNAAITGSIDLNPVDPQMVSIRARAFGATGTPGPYFITELGLPAAELGIKFPPIVYADLDKEIQDILKQQSDIQERANAALKEARDRVEAIRKALAFDPAVRQGNIDPVISDLRQDIDILTQAAARNQQDIALLRDNLTTAGLEVIPGEGKVRLYAIERIQTEVSQTISNFSISVDAMAKKIELYGSVQTGDLNGLITSITTVQTTLDALRGTISNYVSNAQFSPVEARLSRAEVVLDAQTASITSKASQTIVNAQGTRITTAEQRISASEGRIFQAVQATAGSKFDLDLLPQTLSGFFDFIQRQQSVLQEQYALATTNLAASIDDSGRAVASLKTDLIAFKGENSAQFSELTTSIADVVETSVVRQSLQAARFKNAEASIATESSVRATADTAQTVQITGAISRVGLAEAALTTLDRTVATEKEATATRFSGVTASFGTVNSQITSLSTAYASADLALGSRIDTVTATVGGVSASVTSEATARASADSALGSRIDIVSASINGVDAAVRTEATSRASGDTANANSITDLYARNGVGTAYGRFYMEAIAAPAGVSAKIAAQVSTESYGVRRNAGWAVELMPDGTSRFVVDANAFAITANGGTTYPFTFDGTTLSVPAIRVGGQSILANAISEKRIETNNGMDPGGSADGWRDIPGTDVYFNVDSEPGHGLVYQAVADIEAIATGTNQTYRVSVIDVAVAINGNPVNGEAFVAASIGAGGGLANSSNKRSGRITRAGMNIFGPGQQRIHLRYRYKGDEGCRAYIHFAQVQTVLITK